MRLLAISLVLISSMTANAAPVTWVVSDAVYTDGRTLTGQFDYDADTNTYSNISLQSSTKTLPWWEPGTGITPDDPTTVNVTPLYNDIHPWGHPVTELILSTNNYSENDYVVEFFLFFDTALTGAGGTRQLSASETFFGGCTGCDPGNQQQLISGQISAVPIPAAAWLFGSALAGLGWLRRKHLV